MKISVDYRCDRAIDEYSLTSLNFMHFTEVKKLPLLVLIDFEKAFDSMSSSFIYKDLKCFGFGEHSPNIPLVKILNTNFKAAILQSSFFYQTNFLLREIRMQARRPLFPLFPLCAEILSTLIKQNNDIKGIVIHGEEHKISQSAYDTCISLFLLAHLIQYLQLQILFSIFFSKLSGMKVNCSKTNII